MGRRAVVNVDISVGRGANESLQLTDSAVSRHHLTLRPDPQGRPAVQVAEIAGVNPVWTLVGGQRVDVRPGHILEQGATLTLGSTTLRFEPAPSRVKAPGRATVEIDARVTEGPDGSERLAALAALGDRLARCDGLQAVYKEATTWALTTLPASRALLLSPDGRDILGAATDGACSDLALSRALLNRVLAERRAFLVGDVLSEPDLADRRSVQIRGTVGAMAAPAANLVFYVDWGAVEAVARVHDEDALLL